MASDAIRASSGHSPSRQEEESDRSTDAKDRDTEHLTGEKVLITEEECYDELGFAYPSTKKWTILTIIFLVQVSMNFNASLYSNAVSGISKEFDMSEQAARCGAMIFLVAYAFGLTSWQRIQRQSYGKYRLRIMGALV
jgi:hypothetical protein